MESFMILKTEFVSDYSVIYNHLAHVEQICKIVLSDNFHTYLALVIDDGHYSVFSYDFQDAGDSYKIDVYEMSVQEAVEESKDMELLAHRYQIL